MIGNTKKFSTTETKMRLVLTGLLLLILAGMVTGFLFAYSLLKDTAEQVSRTQSEAEYSDAKLNQIILQQQEMEKYQDVVDKAEQIVAESKKYQYQNQIIEDLSKYAKQAKLDIRSFDFKEAGSPTAKKPNQSTAGNANNSTQKPNNKLKSTLVEIRLGNNPSYTKLLHFIHLIEQNLTRMQITSLTMNGDRGGGPTSRQNLTIEVYVK